MNTGKQPLLFSSNNIRLSECSVRRTRSYTLVKKLIRLWHSRLPNAPAGFRVAFLIVDKNENPIGVATFGRPVARLEEQLTTLELTRLAHAPNAPKNMGTWALARMREWIRENMIEVERIISYQDADYHDGALYKADNWEMVYEKHQEHTWTNRPGRKGTERQHKIKWEYML